MIKLSDYVIQFIAKLGVKHIFMLPGGGAMHLDDSIGNCKDIQFVVNLHEQACAIAAEAYARVTNNYGAAVVTTGPGGTNAITGLAAAWLDSTPCFFISGQVKRSDIVGNRGLRQLGVQEIDIVSIVKPLTKYAVTVLDPGEIKYHLEKAALIAKIGRPGPVWIDIPLDVQAAMIDPETLIGFSPEIELLVMDENESIKKAIEWLNASDRPVVLVGNGVRLAGAEKAFLEMVKTYNLPVLTTRLGVDLIAADHPLYMGMPGSIASRAANFILQNSDWLLILGARLDMAMIAYAPEKLARGAKKIMVNIDAAEIQKMGNYIDLPLAMDAKRFIVGMLEHQVGLERADRTAWHKKCRDWLGRYPFVLPEYFNNKQGISAYAFSSNLSDQLAPEDIILPGNAGFASEIFLTALKVKSGQRVFHNKGTGAMGFSQPAAIGACLGGGKRRTVCVDGDGGFQMNIQELETIKRLNLPIKFFVMNNQGYASIRSSQETYFHRLTAADGTSGLTLPDNVRLSEAYGIKAMRISDPVTMNDKIREVLSLPGPVICDVVLVPNEPRIPRVASIQKPDGSMVSKPLEDMSPLLPRDEFNNNMIVPPIEE